MCVYLVLEQDHKHEAFSEDQTQFNSQLVIICKTSLHR